jgi:adenosylcobinamide kinase/adenosylcobinamide-phosphate guanylyltransferase
VSLTLLLGGARSGKSSLAVEIGDRYDDGPVTFIATAPAVDGDMERRIERHQAERPSHWVTIEEQLDLESTITSIDRGLIIVDCLTLWTSNMMWHDRTDDEIRSAATDVSDVAHAHAGDVVVISNEVGLGIHPDNDLGRRYRDLHGWVNQRWAQTADRSMFVVAGKAIVLDDPLRHLPFRSSPRSEPT